MAVDIEEAKRHFANRPAWHHIKGKVIEVGLYATSGSIKLNKPAPRNLPVWSLDGDQLSLDEVLRVNQTANKMTVLNFGSITCPVWRERQPQLQKLLKLYADKVSQICIYVREAHASDEWSLDMNEKLGISHPLPQTVEERIAIAKQAKDSLLDDDALVYVDGPQKNAVNKAYRAVPIRLCAIDKKGDLVFRTEGSGPFGYKPGGLAAFLVKTIGPREGVQDIFGDVEVVSS